MDFRGEVIKEIYVIDEAWEGFHVLTNKRSIEVYKRHSLERLDSMIEAVSGKRLTYAGLTA